MIFVKKHMCADLGYEIDKYTRVSGVRGEITTVVKTQDHTRCSAALGT